MGELIVNDTIEVETSHGKCLVELCSGSITALKVKDRVDTIVISAFPGDYSPTPSSVVGALLRDLRVNVRNLASNKEEDLRKLFSCWWSKPLPENLPYGRLLCFEGSFKKNTSPPATVSEVFRSLVSLAKNKDMTAIMPLLAAGDQGYDNCMMLGLLVNAAVNWMQTGLPLKRLKIVLFSRKPTDPDRNVLKAIAHFESLKNEWVMKWKETIVKKEITHDIYLSHSITDKAYLENVRKMFKQDNKELRIYSEYQEVDRNSSWQKDIFEVISSCAKVVALLTPNYIREESCIEQFNIAMCCSRQQNMLAPFYMQAIVQMPTYMGLIQYIDCRALDNDTISDACSTIITTYQIEKVRFTDEDKQIAPLTDPNEEFDVFVSYCHRDMDVAVKIVEQIKNVMPDWKIFFDQNDLRVGTAWQLKLYSSVENTKFMVALLSDSYLDSKVCQEEYNLARAMNDDPNYKTRLLEIKLKNVEEWPTWCTPINLYDVTGADDEKRTQVVIRAIAKINKKIGDLEDSKTAKYMGSISQITSRWRHAISTNMFPVVANTSFAQTDSFKYLQYKYQSRHKFDVLLSYHSEDKHFGEILMKELVKILPNINISFPIDDKLRLHEIDQATIIIPLLSENYVMSSERMEEFHTALCRHRFSEEIVFFPITVRVLPMRPVYPHIVFNLFSVTDDFWSLDSDGKPELCLSVAATVICNLLVREPRVSTAFRTLFSVREIVHSADELLLRCSTSSQLPLYFYSQTVNSNIWCLNEYGQVNGSPDFVQPAVEDNATEIKESVANDDNTKKTEPTVLKDLTASENAEIEEPEGTPKKVVSFSESTADKEIADSSLVVTTEVTNPLKEESEAATLSLASEEAPELNKAASEEFESSPGEVELSPEEASPAPDAVVLAPEEEEAVPVFKTQSRRLQSKESGTRKAIKSDSRAAKPASKITHQPSKPSNRMNKPSSSESKPPNNVTKLASKSTLQSSKPFNGMNKPSSSASKPPNNVNIPASKSTHQPSKPSNRMSKPSSSESKPPNNVTKLASKSTLQPSKPSNGMNKPSFSASKPPNNVTKPASKTTLQPSKPSNRLNKPSSKTTSEGKPQNNVTKPTTSQRNLATKETKPVLKDNEPDSQRARPVPKVSKQNPQRAGLVSKGTKPAPKDDKQTHLNNPYSQVTGSTPKDDKPKSLSKEQGSKVNPASLIKKPNSKTTGAALRNKDSK